MPSATQVTTGKWTETTVLFDDGVYSVVEGLHEGTPALGQRWNGSDGDFGFPQQSGNSLWHVVPDFLRVSVLRGILAEVIRTAAADHQRIAELLRHVDRLSGTDGADERWMRRAVDLAKMSAAEEGRQPPPPMVGVVIVKDGRELAAGFRGQRSPGDHAEYCALKDISPNDLVGATVYTTLEPCTNRGAGKTPCVRRLIDGRVAEVVIGLYDPNPRIYREGWRMLRDRGIRLREFAGDLRNELRCMNAAFLDQFRLSATDRGQAVFDYFRQPEYSIGGPRQFRTKWSGATSGRIYAIAKKGHLAVARHAGAIAEVTDPAALEFDPDVYTLPVDTGGVVVLHDGRGTYAIIRIDRVLAQDRGDDRFELAFTFEIRGQPEQGA